MSSVLLQISHSRNPSPEGRTKCDIRPAGGPPICSMAVEIVTSIWSNNDFDASGMSVSTTTAMAKSLHSGSSNNTNLSKAGRPDGAGRSRITGEDLKGTFLTADLGDRNRRPTFVTAHAVAIDQTVLREIERGFRSRRPELNDRDSAWREFLVLELAGQLLVPVGIDHLLGVSADRLSGTYASRSRFHASAR